MKIILISSISRNGFIGKNNKLMWHLPNDLKRFKNMTVGNPILMGRKTFESIGRILPGRKNIILTKKKYFSSYNNENFKLLSSMKEVYDLTYEKIFVIGGEEIYTSIIDQSHIIELTIVHKKFYGDKKFPKIHPNKWKKTYEFFYEKDKHHLYDYSFVRFERKG
ncbi:MAG: dihydrofolate reductase [Flavobacteriales bacterium]|jgi:dihydrofolate reductase|uniref:dihydrofolate reductase n=1 Tax=Blattabacterium sp. (Mastotermes darwiniensis) TaxID=39768 RepID=UPI000231DFD1|nr:dihydrofolate reductase [Blattabacterium sp. (Mastotermes darwiniensis)]AER40489.1 dihydrofolate reductase [Blattabacterium sp. (Mastotermes darwiniensis) str. MADAR]MDR1804996.1 dihydrofolate reductase [Flavobacteriales bacterium]